MDKTQKTMEQSDHEGGMGCQGPEMWEVHVNGYLTTTPSGCENM